MLSKGLEKYHLRRFARNVLKTLLRNKRHINEPLIVMPAHLAEHEMLDGISDMDNHRFLPASRGGCQIRAQAFKGAAATTKAVQCGFILLPPVLCLK